MPDCQIKKGTIIIPPSNPSQHPTSNHGLPAFYIAKNHEFYGPGCKIPDSTITFSVQADFSKKNRSKGERGIRNT